MITELVKKSRMLSQRSEMWEREWEGEREEEKERKRIEEKERECVREREREREVAFWYEAVSGFEKKNRREKVLFKAVFSKVCVWETDRDRQTDRQCVCV